MTVVFEIYFQWKSIATSRRVRILFEEQHSEVNDRCYPEFG